MTYRYLESILNFFLHFICSTIELVTNLVQRCLKNGAYTSIGHDSYLNSGVIARTPPRLFSCLVAPISQLHRLRLAIVPWLLHFGNQCYKILVGLWFC